MSEPVSAFAAYRESNAAKANKKSGANSSKNKNNSGTKANKGRASTGAGAGTARKRTNNNNAANRGKNMENGGSCPRKVTDNKAAAKSKATTKTAAAIKAKDKPSRKSNNKQGGSINASQVDSLVDQLLTDPSKKLTKAEQKKKAELEAYLVRQLEKDDEEEKDDDDYSSDSESESDSDSDDDGDDSQRQVYTDEYTLNSYSDSDDEEEEESSTENSISNLESSSTGIEVSMHESNARKRKSNGELSKSANKSKDKAKTTTTTTKPTNKLTKQNNANASKEKAKEATTKTECKRKSLSKSQEKQTATTTTTTAKTINTIQPHNVAANSTAIETNTTTTIKNITKTKAAANSCPRVMNGAIGGSVVKLEPHSPEASLLKSSSIAEGEKLFRWLLNPLAVDVFFSKYWEEHVCLVKRKLNPTYYENLISFRDIDQMLLDNHVEFTKHIDITSYRNGTRETHNPDGRALPPAVWQQYSDGCSVRLLNPHFFMPALYTLNATMQEYFHCLVGANAYLTPPNSQGFAPHYDDIEAFVLQVEGRKRWRIYKPRNVNEQLPRTSSMNLPQGELDKPILDVVLQPGDLLYFPRGIIHQACTEPGFHSLHVTLSVYQKQAYADLFEHLMPAVLEQAIKTTVDLRRGVPLHLWQHAGLVHENAQTQERAEIMRTITQLFRKTLSAAPLEKLVDKAVDQLAKKYQREALPPELHASERKRTIYGSQSRTNAGGECECDYKMELRTNVRLVRAHIVRLVREEQQYRLYYYADNSREYCEFPPTFIEIEARECASVEVLINSYPQYVGVAQLPLDNDDDKIDLATALWERGLLMVEKPFN